MKPTAISTEKTYFAESNVKIIDHQKSFSQKITFTTTILLPYIL